MGNRYLQMDVGTARPEVLISRLTDKAISSANRARFESESGGASKLERLEFLRRSLDIVSELRNSLDLEVGGEIARNLDLLYEFVADRLLTAGLEGHDTSIDEVLRVLEPLSEGWSQLAAGPAIALPAVEATE